MTPRLATDVQTVVRSSDFELELVGEPASDDGDAGVLLARVYGRWAMTLGAFRVGDLRPDADVSRSGRASASLWSSSARRISSPIISS